MNGQPQINNEKARAWLNSTIINAGVLPNLKGYEFLVDAVLTVVQDGFKDKTYKVYEVLGAKYHQKPGAVERDIRWALGHAHNLGALIKLNTILKVYVTDGVYPLTNAQAIRVLAMGLKQNQAAFCQS
jgi:hypothetical protein